MAQLGMIGLGRMGGNMVRRISRAGHRCVVYDRDQAAVRSLAAKGVQGAKSIAELVGSLPPPRAIWMMVPAAAVDPVIDEIEPLLGSGDILVDGGNSCYEDDLRHADRLAERGIHFVDVGTSGGVWGLERGYCLMVGGAAAAFERLEPVLAALSPGVEAAPRTHGRAGQPTRAEHGYLHCGPPGAGHFVKMVHNGIEYGLMQAYAEGLNILRHAGAGRKRTAADAETTPLRNPERFRYRFDLGEIAELWRRGSVIPSWLLDLAAEALHADEDLSGMAGRVSDSGEGRWTIQAAVETGVPAPVLTSALFARFASRGEDDFANKLLSALRLGFGGHREKSAPERDAKA